MFALSPDGLVAFDAAGRVHHVNPAFSRITGLDGDALLGHPMLDLDDALTGRKLPDAAPVTPMPRPSPWRTSHGKWIKHLP